VANAKNPKKDQAPRPKGADAEKVLTEPTTKHGAVIRFPDPDARLRAITVLGEVQRPYQGLPDPEHRVQYLVTNDHVAKLREHNIPFEILA
jgi:hypothetical protein